ncbi:unnamed protein product [Paramecium sonneborni]|uniref:Uncharacterized protein n=1 Tax=Paramecium sonneborni TaxID=65129 RepID=A0A8S1PHY2_9CILI|nr:unnamed protein product [Paramecium sonneborni]
MQLSMQDFQREFKQLNLNSCICQKGFMIMVNQFGKNVLINVLHVKEKRLLALIIIEQIQSIMKRYPGLSGFYQDENENVQNVISNVKVFYIKRQLYKLFYFQNIKQMINIQFNCCKQCQDSSNNCLSCFSNVRNTPPLCNCNFGFFENSTQNCERLKPSENQCETCEKSRSNFLTCKKDRYTQLCVFQEEYNEGGYPYRICINLFNYQQNVNIKRIRMNQSQSKCPDGFYDDFISQICGWLCQTCNLKWLFSFYGNRILSLNRTCHQTPNSICHIHTPLCSNCSISEIL